MTTEPPPWSWPDPPLGDGVVVLRPWRTADVEQLVAAWADEAMRRFTRVPDDPSAATARRFIEGSGTRLAAGAALDLVVVDPADDALILGEVGLSAPDRKRRAVMMGWWTAPAARGRGVATRAVRLVADWAVGLSAFDTLVAEIEPENEASRRIARAAGFGELVRRYEGRIVYVRRGDPRSDDFPS